jgi:hypothetical protein
MGGQELPEELVSEADGHRLDASEVNRQIGAFSISKEVIESGPTLAPEVIRAGRRVIDPDGSRTGDYSGGCAPRTSDSHRSVEPSR